MKKRFVLGVAALSTCLIGSALSRFVAGQKSPSSLSPEQAQAVADSLRRSQAEGFLPERLNRESEATDAAGIRLYAEDLVRPLVPDRAGRKYAESFADRLAAAEELARAEKGHLVPEEKVAEAYNNLMKGIGAPASLLSDEAAVRRTRRFKFVEDPSPALESSGQNGTSCNPGEAVFLLARLLADNGGPRKDLPPSPMAPSVSKYPPSNGLMQLTGPQAGMLLSSYYATHSPRAAEALLNSVAKTLGF